VGLFGQLLFVATSVGSLPKSTKLLREAPHAGRHSVARYRRLSGAMPHPETLACSREALAERQEVKALTLEESERIPGLHDKSISRRLVLVERAIRAFPKAAW